MITVTAAIIEKNGLVFTARRKSGTDMDGYWEFPGGKVEPGENPPQCLQRELGEEFGIEVTVGDFFMRSVYSYPDKTIELLCYFVTHVHGNFEKKDHDRIAWLQPEELPQLKWAPADIPPMKQLVAARRCNTTYTSKS